MSIGREKCKILKEIRRRIAEVNGIEYVTSECRYKGDCAGTCPKCEGEVRYLEDELRARRLLGKAVMLAGVSAGVVGLAGGAENLSANVGPELRSDKELAMPAVYQSNRPSGDSVKTQRGEVIIEHPGEEVIIDNNDFEPDPDVVYTVVTESARYPEGNDGLTKFLSQNMRYPKQALDDRIEGVVVCQFVVDTLGNHSGFKIIRHANPLLEEEALRLVKTLPKFIPAKYKGVKVKSWFTVPVRFRLPKDEKTEVEGKGV